MVGPMDGKSRDGSRPRVLLVEDNALIGLALADALRGIGFDVAGPAATHAAARDELRRNRPDCALINRTLTGGPAEDLFEQLRLWDVPFAWISGAGRDGPSDETLGTSRLDLVLTSICPLPLHIQGSEAART